MPSSTDDQYVLIAFGVLGVVVLLYSVLIAQQLLLGTSVVVWLLVLYLLWRFVRAHERIADALETRDDRE